VNLRILTRASETCHDAELDAQGYPADPPNSADAGANRKLRCQGANLEVYMSHTPYIYALYIPPSLHPSNPVDCIHPALYILRHIKYPVSPALPSAACAKIAPNVHG
jgi:hypothetical protein